jgi:hypothetical protein
MAGRPGQCGYGFGNESVLMSEVIIAFKPSFQASMSELLIGLNVGPGVDVGNLSFNADSLAAGLPLHADMDLVDTHDAPVILDALRNRILCGEEIDLCDNKETG